jgi:hypothetical protein
MRLPIHIAAAAAAFLAGMIARADTPGECSAIPLPGASEVAPWARGGPYAAGLAMHAAGKPRQAGAAIEAAWKRVRRDLAPAFTETCDRARVRKALARNVLAMPPLAVPAGDRFVPPPAVFWTAARAICEGGEPRRAAAWLLETAAGGDPEATSAVAALWSASGRPRDALALLPAAPATPLLRAARALALARSGATGEARSLADAVARGSTDAPAPRDGSQAAALLRLVEATLATGSAPGGGTR